MITNEWEWLHIDRTKFSLKTETDNVINVDREGLKKKSPSRKRGNAMSIEALIIGKRNIQSKKIMGRIKLARVLVAKITRNLI